MYNGTIRTSDRFLNNLILLIYAYNIFLRNFIIEICISIRVALSLVIHVGHIIASRSKMVSGLEVWHSACNRGTRVRFPVDDQPFWAQIFAYRENL